MGRRIILDKGDGSKEVIDGCQNCGSYVKGFYELFYFSGKWVCRKCYNYENKVAD